ncbi:MAG: hypothetical protein ACOYMG_07980, partial [Candidatus Methylumidiphilus sp.]
DDDGQGQCRAHHGQAGTSMSHWRGPSRSGLTMMGRAGTSTNATTTGKPGTSKGMSDRRGLPHHRLGAGLPDLA